MTQRPLVPRPRAILFDLDDTLCDYSSARRARLRHAFSIEEAGETRADFAQDLEAMIADSIRMHPHGVDHFGELFENYGVRDPRLAEAAARWYRENRFHGLTYFPDAESVLRAVRFAAADANGTQRPVGIITNGPTDVQRAKAELLGVADLVDFILISDEFGVAKPDARIFEEALRQAGVEAAEAVFIGDSPEHDMAGAHAVGIPSIWVNLPGIPWNQLFAPPHREVRSVADVPALVGSPAIVPAVG